MRVKVNTKGAQIRLESEVGTIVLDAEGVDAERSDFAAWFFLPIAMRQQNDNLLFIEGIGSSRTQENALKMSRIWQSWLPHHFRSLRVEFAETKEFPQELPTCSPLGNELCFYSGGIDSTHGIYRRHLSGQQQTILTVLGMDYKFGDAKKFEQFIDKIKPFSTLVSEKHRLVSTNANDVYKTFRVNGMGHVSVGFILGGFGSLYGHESKTHVISSDFRLDQHFLAFPYGSNHVTNPLFSDGRTSMVTDSLDVTRTEKASFLLGHLPCLETLTFCTDKKSRPDNCGICQKCIRTKAMFLAATASIPPIFNNIALPKNWFESFDLSNNLQRTWYAEILFYANDSGTLTSLPSGQDLYQKITRPLGQKRAFTTSFKKFFRVLGS